MKLFWIIILLFALAAGGMVWAQSRGGSGGMQYASSIEQARRAPANDPLIANVPAAAAQAPLQPVPEETSGNQNDSAAGAAQMPEAERADARSGAGDFDAVDEDQLAQELVDDLLPEYPPAPPYGAGAVGPDHEGHLQGKPNPDLPPREENPWMAGAAPQEKQPIEHSIEQQADGSTLVDGMFSIKGKGTADAPYEITWDLLMSAAETYQPRLGMEELPERIKMLDGAHVKISGFLMFPMATFEAKEALIMLNMWDGCCIGTMPSPYDAVEVQFTQGVPASTRQFANYGSIEGRLIVDPYLISDWLIGLYVLEDATLNVGM